MSAVPRIALLATLDTKGDETEYVRTRVRELGGEPLVIDTGILGEPAGCEPDVTRAEVARAGGRELEEVRTAGSRGAAVELMQQGARAIVERLWRERRLDGALCLGGAEGALLGAAAMAALPVGVPKLIVSPSASGRRPFGPFVGETDTLVMHSVTDILGLSAISRAVFDNAAAAVVGMARDAGRPVELSDRAQGGERQQEPEDHVQRAAGVEVDPLHVGAAGPAEQLRHGAPSASTASPKAARC